ncbi:MAG: sporulation protein [Deltaproteobacteria bacterium]|nr:sporulation protein [Deltaproteobacteria bacterium]
MAENNRVSEILKDIVGELKDIASSQTIIGEAISVGEKTVIPVVKISVGFGAGGGQGESPEKGGGFGGGGGGAARIEPAAFIIMDGDKVQMLSAGADALGQAGQTGCSRGCRSGSVRQAQRHTG